ncbi:MAG: sugar transferase [Propionicimonas sp.]
MTTIDLRQGFVPDPSRATPFSWSAKMGAWRARVGWRAVALDLAIISLIVVLFGVHAPTLLAYNIAAATAFLATMAWLGAYNEGSLRRRVVRPSLPLTAAGRVLIPLAAVTVLLPDPQLHQTLMLTAALAGGCAVGRLGFVRWLRARQQAGRFRVRLLVRGSARDAAKLEASLADDPAAPFEVVAVQATSGHLADPRAPFVVPRSANLVHAALRLGIDAVAMVGPQAESPEQLRRTLWNLGERGVDASMVPIAAAVAAPRVDSIGNTGVPIATFHGQGSRSAANLAKGALDRIGAGVGLILLLPLFLTVAAAIKLTSPGPVLFRQVRVGRGGSPFHMLKFRTMVADAEARRAELSELNVHGGETLFKIREDPRITPVGRLLRRYSLDELPQLVNVARGEMSLVGPRPSLPREVAAYPQDALRRLAVKPGLTGLWQVSGRADLEPEQSIQLDNRYVEDWSLALDAAILLRTVRAVVTGQGAY